MVDVRAFHGLRYRADDLAPVLAPPYDVISDELRNELYDRSPQNVVRIDFNRPEAGDEELTRYERARRILDAWRTEGVVAADRDPALYILAQTFTGPDGVTRTRTGMFGQVALHRFDEGVILPHERTLRGPKLDRLRLFRSTQTNLSPIFMMYRDAAGSMGQLLAEQTSRAPDRSVRFDNVQQDLWVVTDADAVRRLGGQFADQKLYIADGHHRYETSLAYRDERRADAPTMVPGGSDRAAPGYEYTLAFMAAAEDPGMVVFPTHRLVHSLAGFSWAAFLDKLGPFFELNEGPAESEAFQAALESAGQGRQALGIVGPSARVIATARADAPWDSVPTLSKVGCVRALDVSLLHSVIFEHVLGISQEDQATQKNLRYVKVLAPALEAPAAGDAQVSFIMNAPSVADVMAVADAGEVMPQKSTFFAPKIPSGLVFAPLD